jgi:hypothetical protein
LRRGVWDWSIHFGGMNSGSPSRIRTIHSVKQCREVKNHRTLQHIEYTANLRLDTLTAYSTRPPLRIRLPTRAA